MFSNPSINPRLPLYRVACRPVTSPTRGFPAYCADLTRLGWISGLLPSALSAEYFKGELVSSKTLQVQKLLAARAAR